VFERNANTVRRTILIISAISHRACHLPCRRSATISACAGLRADDCCLFRGRASAVPEDEGDEAAAPLPLPHLGDNFGD